MKNLLYCIPLILGSFSPILGKKIRMDFPYGFNGNSYEYRSDLDNNKNLGIFQNNGSYNFEFDEGNPDVHGNKKRPCQAYDTFCIRKFFAEHSKCKISDRRVPNPFYRAQGTVNYPTANMTAIASNLVVYEGLDNGRVEEFFIDTVTDNLIIAFAFDAIRFSCNTTNLKLYLRGREPEVHQGYGTLIFDQITITMVIPGLHDLRLDRAEITTYLNNPIQPFVVSPTLALSTNPEVLAMTVFFVTVGLQNENLDQLSTEGVFFAGNYLQYNICDFGLKVL